MSTLREMLEIPKGKQRYIPVIDSIPTDIQEVIQREYLDFVKSKLPIQQYICKDCHEELPRSKTLSDIGYSFGTMLLHGPCKYMEWEYGRCDTCIDKLFEELNNVFYHEEPIERTSHLDFQDVEKEPVELSIDIDQCSDEEQDEVMNLLKEYKY
jgi:hypothetical protein